MEWVNGKRERTYNIEWMSQRKQRTSREHENKSNEKTNENESESVTHFELG